MNKFDCCEAHLEGCLIDCGFSKELRERCQSLQQEKETGELIKLLKGRREELIESIHGAEKQVELIDFMIYTLEKKGC